MKIKSLVALISSSLLLNGCLIEDTSSTGSTPTTGTPSPSIDSLHQLADELPIGAALPAGNATNSILKRNDLQELVAKHFNQITAENIMKPDALQAKQGEFTYEDADALIAFAQKIGASVHGHTLVWHNQIPDWMKSCADKAACTDVMTTHVTKVAQHFANKVVSWDVVNEAFNDDGTYRNTGDQGSIWYQKIGEDYIKAAYTAARAADSKATLYYNDYSIENNGKKLDAALAMVESLKADNLIDGIGFQMHIKLEEPSIENISASLKKAQQTGLMVKITELDIQLNASGKYSTLTADLAEQQQKRYEAVVAAYLKEIPKAQRGGVSVWGVSDADSWIPPLYGNADWPLLFDENLKAKLALQGFADALSADSGVEPEVPALFLDTFDAEPTWYKDGQSNVEGTFPRNSNDNVLDVTAKFSGAKDENFGIANAFGEGKTIDFTSAKTLSFKIKVPAEFGNEGALAIQPFIMDGNYTPAYLGYQFGTAGEWATITIKDVTPDFSFGYNGNPDFSKIDRVGLQFIANGEGLSEKTISIDDVKITE